MIAEEFIYTRLNQEYTTITSPTLDELLISAQAALTTRDTIYLCVPKGVM